MWKPYVGAGAAPSGFRLIAPNDPRVTFSDLSLALPVLVSELAVRINRPDIGDGNGYYRASPGSRIRFATNAREVGIRLLFRNYPDALGIIRQDTFNSTGMILVNGVEVSRFSIPQALGTARGMPLLAKAYVGRGPVNVVEVVLPYCAAIDFLGVLIPDTADLWAATAPPAIKLCTMGDSITHGFSSTYVGASWPYKLAAAKGWQLANLGFGGMTVNTAQGTAGGNTGANVFTYLIGYNNFSAQTALATFKASYKAALTALRAVTGAKCYCITPTWTGNTNTLTIENYRQQIRDALTELGNAANILVEGGSLGGTGTGNFPDSIHPNDTASAAIASTLSGVVVV